MRVKPMVFEFSTVLTVGLKKDSNDDFSFLILNPRFQPWEEPPDEPWEQQKLPQYKNRFNGFTYISNLKHRFKPKKMSHSLNKIWIHAIWTTKERLPLIEPEIEKEVFYFMAEQFREMGSPVRIINGMPDHVHCLFLLNPQKSVAEVVKQIKGSSTQHINHQNLTVAKFSWQTGYAAYSVSESVVETVFNYIKNQKQHHSKKSFQQEYDEFLVRFGFENQ